MTFDEHGNLHDSKGRFGTKQNTSAPEGLIPPTRQTVPLGVLADRRARERVRELDAEDLYNANTNEFAYTEVENEPFSDDTISCRLATGELADRIRARFDVPAGTRVEITERTHEDGHSEWTFESFTYLKVTADGHEIEFDTEGLGSRNTLVQLLDWLDGSSVTTTTPGS